MLGVAGGAAEMVRMSDLQAPVGGQRRETRLAYCSGKSSAVPTRTCVLRERRVGTARKRAPLPTLLEKIVAVVRAQRLELGDAAGLLQQREIRLPIRALLPADRLAGRRIGRDR